MNQTYHTNLRSQVKTPKKACYRPKHKRGRVTLNGGDPIIPIPTQRFIRRPKAHFEAMTRADMDVLNAMLAFRAHFGWITCPSQNTIAKAAGVSRMTVSRSLFKCERLGALSNNHRWHKTSLYNIAGIFWDKTFIRKFKKMLPALLLLLSVNVTQTSNINLISLFKIDQTDRSYSKSGTNKKIGLSDPNFIHNLILRGENMTEVGEAILKITEIDLTERGKAKLAVFPANVIRKAHEQMVQRIQQGKANCNPFGMLMTLCKDLAPTVDTSHNNPIYKSLQQKYAFSNCDAPLSSTRIEIPKIGRGEMDHASLATRARKIQDRLDSECRPQPGDPITDEHVQAYAKRTTGRGYVYQKTHQKKQHTPPFVDNYDEQASRSLLAICDDWEDKWLHTKEKLGVNHPVLNKDMAKRAMTNMIVAHVDRFKIHGLPVAVSYLKQMIFETPVPESVRRGTLLTDNEYFSFLSEIFNEYKNEIDNDRNNNNNPRETHPA